MELKLTPYRRRARRRKGLNRTIMELKSSQLRGAWPRLPV